MEGAQLFPLVDQATKHLKADLQLPRAHREKATDLPVTQVFTESLAAAKHYAQGLYYEDGREARDQTALTHYRRATTEDSTFALAHMLEGSHHWRFGDRAEARAAYQQAQRHDYRLPKSSRYQLDALVLFWVKQQPRAALQVCERWTELHPYDLEGWQRKASIHEALLQYEAALNSYQQALDLSPKNRTLRFQVGALLLQTGRSGQAAEHFSGLATAYPKASDPYFNLGYARWMQGRHDAARKAFRTGQRIDADASVISMARLHQATGRFNGALRLLRRAARRKDADRGDGYYLWHHYWLRGRIEKSKAVLDSLQAAEVQRRPFHRVTLAWRACHYYTQSEAPARLRDARAAMQDLAEKYEGTIPSYEVMAHVGLTSCNLAVGKLKAAQRHIAAADSIVQATGRQQLRLRYDTDYYRGQVQAARGDHDRAARSYEQLLSNLGVRQFAWTERRPRVQLALAYQRMGATEKARTTYQQALTLFPAYPRLNYHYARFLVDQGAPAEARPHLQRALEGWAPADSTFAPKQRARALADSLRNGVV
jgi:tetratricopeptide (TPR) repeat protein